MVAGLDQVGEEERGYDPMPVVCLTPVIRYLGKAHGTDLGDRLRQKLAGTAVLYNLLTLPNQSNVE